ncbi:MAG TPA: NAD(P)/FAD-dependent oxidoreductase [Nevskiaceae bacterium]|nr:NAD(P)/FAD-dependent oxidoreductase [Nevskiaceae bacterium]
MVEVLLIGAGVSGLCVAARLREAGVASFVILEKAATLGGTWRDNRYPGCACDIPAHLYSYSFEPNPAWSRMFAPQGEILAYLQRMAERRDLVSRIRFGQEVASLRWDDGAGCWNVRTRGGEHHVARHVVSALGALHHPALPRLPGLDRFEGPRFHSATWNDDVDLAGQRVAVIGTGASAIQFVPTIVDRVSRLHVFQRTPPWILPKVNPVFDARRQWRFRNLPLYRRWFRSRLFLVHEERVGGFTGDRARMVAVERLARRHLERQVPDPVLRARVTPDYAIGCKRLLISSDWYPALQKPHAEVVADAIAEVTSNGITTADGTTRPVDVLIFGTGFDTQNNLTRLDVRGRDGASLAERWQGGASAYLGTLVAGFPNLYVMLGPNSGLAHNSQIFMIEAQANVVLYCLRRGGRSRVAVEVRQEVQEAFNRGLAARLAKSVWQAGGCHNWYQDGSGRNTISWPGTSLEFWWRTRWARRGDFR